MSISPTADQQLLAAQSPRLHLLPARFGLASKQTSVRRRANREQGHALEILGHAVEYLVDSRMFLIEEPATMADSEAVQILMRLSREVFSECNIVITPLHRLRLWISSHVAMSPSPLSPSSVSSNHPHH